MWLFYITLLFSVVYLVAYPGLGSFGGTLNWSSTGQYDKEIEKANAQYGPIFARFSTKDLKAVAADPEARQMGERLFLTYCSQCHGSDAKGAKGFPNLTDNDWLYGGEPETIKTSILQGRNGVMPPLGHLGGEPIKDVANYVRSLSGLAADSIRVQRGKELFTQNCVACHGPEGKGMTALGAPNLTDNVWLYGSNEASIIETVAKGRNNQMPAFKDFLGEAKVHILAGYVYGLSAEKPKSAAAK
jgi:cytochrome c oxidase cbb3-type subunit 3